MSANTQLKDSMVSRQYNTDSYAIKWYINTNGHIKEAYILNLQTKVGKYIPASAAMRLMNGIDYIDNNIPEPYAVHAINCLINQH